MKDILIGPDDIRQWHPAFRGKYGDLLIKYGTKISGLQNVNRIYDNSKHLTGPAFCKDVLDKLEIKRTLRNVNVLENFKEKPFITVSNHSYGHVDGIAIIEAVGSRVNNFKMMVNFILGIIDTMADNFITVNPYKKTDEIKTVSLNGIKKSIDHIRHGRPLGFFPAGAVEDFVRKGLKITIEDREWQPSVLKLIQKARVPVIPIHISGGNSPRYYALGIFGWIIRTLGLCHELYNKEGKEMILTFGEPISPEKISEFKNVKELGDFLRTQTYALAQSK